MKIESGTGNGKWASVDINNRLLVNAKSNFAQHIAAREDNSTFQVWGTATLANGTVTPLTIKNNSSTDIIVMTYLRWQLVDHSGGTAIPNASNYMQMGYNTEFSSGGTSVTPVNMTAGANKVSNAVAYQNNPTMSGSITVFDRHYPRAEAEMYTFNKNGASIILPGQSFTVQYVGDHTSGTIYTRMSFYTEALV